MKDEELLRYSRHILLPQIDIEGQERIKNSKAILVGLGGLGSVISMYLASSGVGEMVLIDHDEIEISNLQRQILFKTENIGDKKASVAKKVLQKLNPHSKIEAFVGKIQNAKSNAIIQDADIYLDASDNFETRFFLNELSLLNKVPLVSGAAVRLEGQVSVFNLNSRSPCYQCLFDSSDIGSEQNCSTNGVLSPLLGVIGSMQAIEALKIIGNFGDSLDGRLMIFDSKTVSWNSLKLKKDPACVMCQSSKKKSQA